MKKLFTLIELIVVIVILGILAAIVIPNIENMKEDAIHTAIESNIRNIQTGVDMYSLKNNNTLPSEVQPQEKVPVAIDFNRLEPEFLRNNPKTKGYKYWVDAWGTVWGSPLDSPKDFLIDNDTNEMTWASIEEAKGYNVYEIRNYKGEGVIGKSKATSLTFKEYTTEEKFVGEDGKAYVVSSINEKDLESAPSGIGYTNHEEFFVPYKGFTENSTDKDIPSNEWVTVHSFDYLTSSSSNNTKWLKITKTDNQPTDTLITYSYLASNTKPTGEEPHIPLPQLSSASNELMLNEIATSPTKYLNIKVTIQKRANTQETPSMSHLNVEYDENGVIKNKPFYGTQYRIWLWPDSSTNAQPIFDENISTSVSDVTNKRIRWIGDLTNKAVRLKMKFTTGSSSSSTAGVKIVDKDGKNLTFLNLKTNQYQNEFLYIGYLTDFTLDDVIVIPENAAEIYIYSSWQSHVFEIQEQNTQTKPDIVSNIYSEPSDTSIKLNWTNPNNEEFDRVNIYRDNNIYIGTSKTGTFTDTPLYANQDYKYRLVSIDKSGNTEEVEYLTKTTKRSIEWAGLDPKVFDKILTTSAEIPSGSATWVGNLENKAVRLKMKFTTGSSSSSTAGVKIVDKDGKNLTFLNLTTNQYQNEFLYVGYLTEFPLDNVIVMPKNAAKIQIYSSWRASIFEIQEQNVSTTPDVVKDVSFQPTDTSISIKWTKPKNVTKVNVYRDNNIYVGSSTVDTITNKPLFANHAHSYKLVSIDENGNTSETAYLDTNTSARAIEWRGMDPKMFDKDLNTFVDAKTSYVTWSGDISGKTVRIKALFKTGTSSSSSAGLQVLDSSGKKLSFLNLRTNTYLNEFLYVGYLTDFNLDERIVMPENAHRIYIHTSRMSYIYEIQEE